MATATAKPAKTTDTGARLRIQYNQTIAAELLKELDLKNFHQAPKLERLLLTSVSARLKMRKKSWKLLRIRYADYGQQPVETIAKKFNSRL